MDANDLSKDIFEAWRELVPKDSGELSKNKKQIIACVWTEHGYRQVVGVSINHLGFIELHLDDD